MDKKVEVRKPYRHGDVLLIPVDKVRGTELKFPGDLILAEGEATGHAHRIPAKAGAIFKFKEKTYLRLAKQSALTHEEHHQIDLPAGNYEIKIQKDYEPTGWKKVID